MIFSTRRNQGTSSPVTFKDSFRIIIALVAHFNKELLEMDVEIVFLNVDLQENMVKNYIYDSI